MISRFKITHLVPLFFCINTFGWAAERDGVNFEATKTIDGKSLELNCLGTRTGSKFGITAKVYVAGFYFRKPVHSKEEVFKSERPIYVRLVFERSVDADDLIEGWRGAIHDNCESDCEEAAKGLSAYISAWSDARNGKEFLVTIKEDGLSIDSQLRKPKKVEIKNKAFATAFLKAFFGEHPADARFQRELLCQKD